MKAPCSRVGTKSLPLEMRGYAETHVLGVPLLRGSPSLRLPAAPTPRLSWQALVC